MSTYVRHPKRPCLRCGLPIGVLGCCRDCRGLEPEECARRTADARRYRDKWGNPLPARPFTKVHA